MKIESSIVEKAGFLYLAPLLDGVLLLLVFFICSSSFVLKSGVQVELPASSSNLKTSRNTHIITIMEGNPPKVYFNEARVDADLLDRRFQEGKIASNHVVILADKHSSYGDVMSVALRALNYNYEVSFGTRPNQD